MSGAREQVSRLLALVPYLQSRDNVSLTQVAADFGVQPDQSGLLNRGCHHP